MAATEFTKIPIPREVSENLKYIDVKKPEMEIRASHIPTPKINNNGYDFPNSFRTSGFVPTETKFLPKMVLNKYINPIRNIISIPIIIHKIS